MGCRGGGRGHTHLREGEGGCLPERCRSPQVGYTSLHHAAGRGNAAIVELLLAAGAAVNAETAVREGVGHG